MDPAEGRWEQAVLASLERRKRISRSSAPSGQQDIVHVRILVDRTGRVLSSTIERSRHIASLDEAALDLVRRSSPLPAPPASLADGALEFVVPVNYSITEARP
ncbi:MAG: energy transducer TonB [Sphingomonas sp.]